MSWELRGEYLENCNCDILCPCITSSLQGPADNERCYVPLAMHISEGHSDGVRLDGLNAVLVVDSPAVMGQGGWRVAVYLDERADEQQREALGAVLSGARGGPPEMLAGLVGEQLGVKFVPISFSFDGDRKRVEVPGIMEFEVEGPARAGFAGGDGDRQRIPPDGQQPSHRARRHGPVQRPRLRPVLRRHRQKWPFPRVRLAGVAARPCGPGCWS